MIYFFLFTNLFVQDKEDIIFFLGIGFNLLFVIVFVCNCSLYTEFFLGLIDLFFPILGKLWYLFEVFDPAANLLTDRYGLNFFSFLLKLSNVLILSNFLYLGTSKR